MDKSYKFGTKEAKWLYQLLESDINWLEFLNDNFRFSRTNRERLNKKIESLKEINKQIWEDL